MGALQQTTRTVPAVFVNIVDPVGAGFVESLARPGGNATGINILFGEVVAKRLGLLHDLVPKAARIAVLLNPASASITETMLREIPEGARAVGLRVQFFNASTSAEIEAAFATIARDRADALFIAPDAFFTSPRSQFATLATRDRLPTSCANRAMVEASLLMSYGTSLPDMFHQVGIYTGIILKGTKPADLPVLQSTKFEFIINLQTARALGIEVPIGLRANKCCEPGPMFAAMDLGIADHGQGTHREQTTQITVALFADAA
jgi:putative ABC transport system substrate-binding protein